MCDGLERASIHTNTKGQKEKPEEFQKSDALVLLFTSQHINCLICAELWSNVASAVFPAVSSFSRNENIRKPRLYLKQFTYEKYVPISCYISASKDVNCF